MNLVPVGIPVPTTETPTLPQTENEERLKEQISLAEAMRERTRGTISHIMGKINAMYADLNGYCTDIQSEIASVLSEVNLLRSEMKARIAEEGRRNRPPDDLDMEFKQAQADYGYADQDDEIETITEPKDENPEIVALYRKIANRTHPDKTDDPELQMLFITAKEYRNKGDLKGLQEIWDFLSGNVKKMPSKLRQRLDELVREVATLENQLAYMRHSNDYILLSGYERDRSTVRMMFREHMREKLARLRAHLEMLRRSLGIELPKPVSYLRIST